MHVKQILFMLFAACLFLGCKKCLDCECTKNGQKFMEEECATGINQESGLEYWQKDMMEKKVTKIAFAPIIKVHDEKAIISCPTSST